MLQSVEGIYRDGKVELLEMPSHLSENERVIVTFLKTETVSVETEEQKLNRKEMSDLRSRLETFAEDWESPEMAIYDQYDNAKSSL